MSQPPSKGSESLDPSPGAARADPTEQTGGESSPHNRFGAREVLRPGMQLNGIFEIDAHLASGGMGEVYKGHSIQTGDVVAIKVIRVDFVENETAISLFRKEAAALFHLHHEAIVRYFIFSIDAPSNRAYLAMEFVQGELLSRVLQREPMPTQQVCLLAERIALGLHAAHLQDIIHRDVAPDNIIIPNGDVRRAKLIDFGIARSLGVGHETAVEMGFAGKYSYVSPEQLGLCGGEATVKSDIYSLGLVLLEALTGAKPDMGVTPGAAVEKRKRLPDLAFVDARIRPFLRKMLEPNPAHRPASMLAVAEFFRNLPTTSKRSRRRPVVGAVAALALVGFGIGAYMWLVPAPLPVPRSADIAPPPLTEAYEKRTTGDSPSSDSTRDKGNPPPIVKAHDRVIRFIENYATGPCVSLTSVSVTDRSAIIEGIGPSRDPFDRLDDSFKTANGFEAQIHARLVTPAQCAAVAFFNRFKADMKPSPHIELAASILHGDEPLAGSISNIGDRNVEAFLVTYDGIVQNVTDSLLPGGSKFSIPIDRAMFGPQPGLLIALTSSRPLSSMKPATPLKAETFFPAVQSEVSEKHEPLGVSMQYFKLE